MKAAPYPEGVLYLKADPYQEGSPYGKSGPVLKNDLYLNTRTQQNAVRLGHMTGDPDMMNSPAVDEEYTLIYAQQSTLDHTERGGPQKRRAGTMPEGACLEVIATANVAARCRRIWPLPIYRRLTPGHTTPNQP